MSMPMSVIESAQRRSLNGLTQEQLADRLNISYQQIQKYETGANRVSAGRLFQIASILESNVAYYFEGFSEEEEPRTSRYSNEPGSGRFVARLQ